MFADHIEKRVKNERVPLVSDDEQNETSQKPPSRKTAEKKPITPKKEEDKKEKEESENSTMGRTATSFEIKQAQIKF